MAHSAGLPAMATSISTDRRRQVQRPLFRSLE
jgi:hypothetical protein